MKIRDGHNNRVTHTVKVRKGAFWGEIKPEWGARDRFMTQCTGCLRQLGDCICGRALLNRCIGCNKKLWNHEGKKIKWGNVVREVCTTCALAAPQQALVDGTKYAEYVRP